MVQECTRKYYAMRNATIKSKMFGLEGIVTMPLGDALAIDQHSLNKRADKACVKAGDNEGQALIAEYSPADAKRARGASHQIAKRVALLATQEWSEELAFQRAALSRHMMKGLT
jgi:hypothetical protein